MQMIAVDIGNSAIKFLAGEIHLRLPNESTNSPSGFANTLSAIKGTSAEKGSDPFIWSVVSVNDEICRRLVRWIDEYRPNDRVEIITRSRVPLEVMDSYRETIGVDRLVAAYAAVTSRSEDTSIIIVDAGTAVTIDYVSSAAADGERRFEGGVIFPGAAACLGVLKSATADLPDVSLLSASLSAFGSVDEIIGTQTDMAIANGVRLSQSHAVAGIVAAFNQRTHADVVITGGGAEGIVELLDDEITSRWSFQPQLVLRGALLIGQNILNNENQSDRT
jgi:pantothenate kinase type III